MILIYGTGLYGKVDDVPGMWHVATRFAHLYYVPLLPLGSFIVLGKSGDDFQGMPIPLSMKSIMTAWLRTACVFMTVISLVVGIVSFADHQPAVGAGALSAVLFALSIVGLIASYKVRGIGRATYARAKEHAQRVGVSDQGELMLEVLYGRLSAEEADHELARREAASSE